MEKLRPPVIKMTPNKLSVSSQSTFSNITNTNPKFLPGINHFPNFVNDRSLQFSWSQMTWRTRLCSGLVTWLNSRWVFMIACCVGLRLISRSSRSGLATLIDQRRAMSASFGVKPKQISFKCSNSSPSKSANSTSSTHSSLVVLNRNISLNLPKQRTINKFWKKSAKSTKQLSSKSS